MLVRLDGVQKSQCKLQYSQLSAQLLVVDNVNYHHGDVSTSSFNDILAKRSFSHLRAVFKEYKEVGEVCIAGE